MKASHEDTAWLYPDTTVEDVARSWLDLGANLVVITSGAAGSLALTRRLRLRQPAFRVDVTDTVGAGDAYTAGLLSALVRREVTGTRQLADLGEPLLLEVLHEAAAAAALTCARPGADPPTRSELESLLLVGQSPGAGS